MSNSSFQIIVILFIIQNSMSTYSLQNIITNYELLSHDDPSVRQNANVFLMGLIYQEDAWKITQEMIRQSTNQNYQLLGAQILHQKLQKQVSNLSKTQLHALKQFLFIQLSLPTLNVPTIHKISSAISLIAVVSCIEDWPDLVVDLVKFMKGSASQLQNGLIMLGSLAEELNKNNIIRHGIKTVVKEKILEQEQLIAQVFLSALTISETITGFALQAVENWVAIGFPLLKYKSLITILLMLIQQQHDLFFQSCCKIISEGMRITSQLKFQTLNTIDLSVEMQKYSQEEIQSLKLIILYLRNTKNHLFAAIKTAEGIQDIELYTIIVKEMLLSFGFLLLEDVGFELIQIMVTTLQCKNLKLSYSTFQFWLDFCQKMSKSKLQQQLQDKIWTIVDYLINVILDKTTLDNQSSLFEMVKEDDTVDDMEDVSFTEYRKQAQYVIKTVYEYFTKKKEKEGSNLFFAKLIGRIQKDRNYLSLGTELSIYVVKSSIQSMMKDYDTLNLIQFLQYLINKAESLPSVPPRISAQILSLIKDCNRQIRQRDQLFIKCLAFSLKFVQDEHLCHYAVYAFQSLMESIQNISSTALINDLLAFYQSKKFNKQTVLEKILDGILTSITKLQDRNSIVQYFSRIMNAILVRNNELLSCSFEPDAYFLPLIEIKTVLDCFEHFKPQDKDYFRNIFLNISNQGITIVTRIITNYLEKRLKFSNVNELGLSLAVCKNSLKICEGVAVEYLPINSYISLMNLILCIFNPNDMAIFTSYSNLIQIISKILCQFMNIPIPALNAWLGTNLMPINNFFLSYASSKKSVNEIDPDILKQFFTIQQSVLIYSQQIFLSQPQTQQILNLALISLQYINEKQVQKRVVYFLYLCVQIRNVFTCKYDKIAQALFFAIPILNNICHMNAGRIFIIIFDGVDNKKKENVFRELLEYQPYTDVQRGLKEIMGKFIAFAIQSKVERYIRGVLNDLTDIKWKKSGNDLALHLEMRFSNWKREYNKMIKNGQAPK